MGFESRSHYLALTSLEFAETEVDLEVIIVLPESSKSWITDFTTGLCFMMTLKIKKSSNIFYLLLLCGNNIQFSF